MQKKAKACSEKIKERLGAKNRIDAKTGIKKMPGRIPWQKSKDDCKKPALKKWKKIMIKK